jgi:hypothetical protein
MRTRHPLRKRASLALLCASGWAILTLNLAWAAEPSRRLYVAEPGIRN